MCAFCPLKLKPKRFGEGRPRRRAARGRCPAARTQALVVIPRRQWPVAACRALLRARKPPASLPATRISTHLELAPEVMMKSEMKSFFFSTRTRLWTRVGVPDWIKVGCESKSSANSSPSRVRTRVASRVGVEFKSESGLSAYYSRGLSRGLSRGYSSIQCTSMSWASQSMR